MIKKVNAAFWKSERMLLYFLCISLLLVVLSVINPDRRCVDFLLLYWIKKQEFGIIAFSIFLGFLSLWLYSIKEREKEVFQKEEFDKLGKIDYHRKKADENITRRLIKTTLGKWKDEYKAQTI